MPKIKTHKATAKRFKVTGKDKLTRRKAGQNHFNSQETGATTRKKRRDIDAHKTNTKTIKQLNPYR